MSGNYVVAAILVTAGCGGPEAETESGITGLVLLGPQCPVEVAGDPCEDRPAGNVAVSVSAQIPGGSAAGQVAARGTTDANGAYRIVVASGDYVVTAEAGMSCELMEARVAEGVYSTVVIPCDTGIR